MELLEELPEPTSSSHAVGHSAILSFGARSVDDVLLFGGSGDKIVAEEHSVARGGSACIRATCPVRICVDHQLGGGGGALQVEAKVQGASQIAQDVLHRGEVRLPGIMHMKANLLDGVGDIGASERQVLEGSGEAHELNRISNMRDRSGRDLGLRVHGCRDRLVVHHAGVLKDVESELRLSEEESIDLMLYRDPQKMVKKVDILHDKFPLEDKYGVLQERCARCGEHNIINIKQQVYRIGVMTEYEQGGVRLGLNKF
jgi:hypothetical protein